MVSKKYWGKILILIALLAVFFSAYNANKKEVIPQYVLEQIKTNRAACESDNLLNELKSNLYQYTHYSEEQANITPYLPKMATVTKTQAEEDIRYLFALLHYGYAGYGYFGGDTIFNNAEQSIIETVNSQKGDSIQSNALATMMLQNLSFLQDGHFFLNDGRTIKPYYYMDNETHPVKKVGDHYYVFFEKKQYRILSINGEAPEKYMKLSLDQDGRIVFYFGTLTQDIGGVFISVKLQSGSAQSTQDLFLKPELSAASSTPISYYSLSSEGGIPEITSYSFAADSASVAQEIDNFCGSAKIVRDRPGIVDISRNDGGDSVYADQWFYNYTGRFPQISMATADLCTKTTVGLIGNSFQVFADESRRTYVENLQRSMLQQSQNKERPYLLSSTGEKRFDNPSILVVITGKKTASSAELFAYNTKTLNNVLFAGTNTFGALRFGNVVTTYLPNSGIPVSFGTTQCNTGIMEGVGLMPDFWMNPGDAARRIAKFLKHYDISSIKSIKY